MFLNDEEYTHVLDLLDGKIEKSPLLEELTTWMKQEFDVTIYDYICDYIQNGQIRLRIVVWNLMVERSFYNGYNYDSEKQKKIAGEFARLARKYNLHPEYHNEKDIFVCIEMVEDQIIRKTFDEVKPQILVFEKSVIWKIVFEFTNISVFYETDEQVKHFEEIGLSDAIREKFSEILKANDKYNVFKDGVCCLFTSRQTLNEKYQGNLFYYFKR